MQMSADAGNRLAQWNFGSRLYTGGNGVEQNYRIAAQYFKAAAEQGDSDAMDAYGMCLYYGHGVPRNRNQARAYVRESAARDNPSGVAHYRELKRELAMRYYLARMAMHNMG
jgi:TPR repeat protein